MNRRVLNLGGSAFVFGCGTAALYVVDLVLVANLADSDLANWAFLKSLVFIGGGMVVFGMDHAVLRAPMKAKKFFPPLLLQICVFALPFIGVSLLEHFGLVSWTTWASVSSLGVILGVGGFLRSQYRIFESIVFLQGWRIVFLALLLTTILSKKELSLQKGLSVALGGWAIVALIYVLCRDRPTTITGDSVRSFLKLYPVSCRFWGLALLANGMGYLDQVILNLDGQKSASAGYYAYTSIFLPIMVLATGFLANAVNPYLRKHGEALRSKIPLMLKAFVCGAFALLILSFIVGIGIGSYIGRFSGVGDVNVGLLVTVLIIGVLRYLYLFPSAVLGVFGTKRELDRWLVAGFVSIGVMVFTYLVVRGANQPALIAIALAMIVNLGFRVVYGSIVAARILNSGRPLEVSI